MDLENNQLKCTQCEAVGTPHFTYKTKTGAIKPFGKCKICHNKGKYQKKPKGFAKLPVETQAAIRNMLEATDQNGQAVFPSLRMIAAKFELSYANLKRWIANDEHL